jgi:hypothetical protein
MTDTSTNTEPTPTDDAAIVAKLSVLSKDDLQNLAGMRIHFLDDAPAEVRQMIAIHQRIAQEMLDEDTPQA